MKDLTLVVFRRRVQAKSPKNTAAAAQSEMPVPSLLAPIRRKPIGSITVKDDKWRHVRALGISDRVREA